MTIKKISNFVFPTGSKTLSQDAYYKALSEAGSGFYPFGENSLWHGGIHIDKNVLNKIGNDDLLRCMANGEVIAYRVNDVYPKIIYEDNNEVEAPVEEFQKVAYFSTGFTLVRHYLKMPEISASTETPPAITLYSLYMHQLDWYGYEQKKNKTVDDKINYPHYWQVQSGKVNEEKAGAIYGSVIRENGKDSKVVGLLLKGSKVRLGEQKKGKSGWYKITSITQGILVTKNEYKNELGSTSGYVWKGDIGTSDTDRPTGNKAEADKDYEICLEDNYKVDSPEKEVKGIAVYEAANDTQKLTYLPITATFEFDGQENGYAKIRKIEGCSIPPALVAENGGADAPHKGYVNIESLTSTVLKPEKFNEVIVLKQPIAIKKGDFIGYLGHNVSQSQSFDEPKVAALATMKRPSDEKLPKLAHIELFTCDDLPAFIEKTKALANNLPEYEKTIILVEKDAQLIQATHPTGFLHKGLGIEFISLTNSYYVKIKPVYTLNLSITPSLDTKTGEIIKGDGKKYYLTQEDKKNLLESYKQEYPQLIKSDIPDEVEIVNDIIASSTVLNKDMKTSITIRFSPENVYYWIASKDVFHLKGLDGQLNSTINYWNDFPLSLDGVPEPKQYNTVYFARTISLNSQSDESFIAVNDDDPDTIWRYIQAGNKEGIPIQGWVNTKNGVQEHIKLVTPWHWSGFNTVEEKSKVGQLSAKIVKNKMAKLDFEDYSPAMKELHQILVGTLRYSTQRKKTPPSFTEDYLKEGLRRSWTAERIGHLLVKYESEWYADEALTKWNEIDELFEEEKDEKKEFMSKLLDGLGIDKEYLRKFAFDKVDEELEYIKRVWQIEKKKRIKPSLWWKDVADKQASQSTNTNNDAPTLTNLSKDGKAWFIHPVAMVDYFSGAGIVTYHIYQDGKIEKHIPENILPGFERKYKYVYHDKDNNKHEVCIVDWHTTKKKKNGVRMLTAPNRKDKDILEYKENVNEGNTQKRVKYKNGDIAEYGWHSQKEGNMWRKYVALDEEIEIVRMPDEINYVKDNIIIKYQFSNTKRRYTGPAPLAGFIGALAEVGFELITTGSCFYEASCFPSSEHVNGTSVDTTYIQNVDKDQKIIDAMAKFHFIKRLIGINQYCKKLSNAEHHNELHDSHLHSGDFDETQVKIITI